MNSIIKVEELMKVLPEEDIKECGWDKDDHVVVTVTETQLSDGKSFKSISLDEEFDVADMDSQETVPMTKKELAGYIVDNSISLLKLLNEEESQELSND
tara:strand:+ start:210 stop:506 length:297 start_codon:yes stop_codon:yes gene_type:complete